MKNKLLARSCLESYQYVSYVMFFTSREGVVGISPLFWGSVYPPLFTLFTHPNARGCQCGFTGSTWPVTTTRINLTSLWTMGDIFISWLHPVESMSTCRLCPDFKSEWPQKKGVERQLVQPLDFPADAVSSFDVGFLMSFFRASFHSFGVCDNKTFCNVQLDGVLDGNERKVPPTTIRFYAWWKPCPSFIWRLRRRQVMKCTTRRRTLRRRTRNTQRHQLAFIRNEESDLHHRLVVCMWK